MYVISARREQIHRNCMERQEKDDHFCLTVKEYKGIFDLLACFFMCRKLLVYVALKAYYASVENGTQ